MSNREVKMVEEVDDGFGEVFRQEWRVEAPPEGMAFVVLDEEWVVDDDDVPRRIIKDVKLWQRR